MRATPKPMKVLDSGRAQGLQVVAGACTAQGAQRDTNEDDQYVSPDLDLFIVADGIGGHAGDDVTCVLFYVQSDSSSEPPSGTSTTVWQRLKAWFKRT